jgi:hypothetical protein
MKLLITLFWLFILPVMIYEQARTNQTVEFTRDNPSTLISTNSSDYTILGFKLGMSPAEAQRILAQHRMLVGEQDQFNSSRIYVYDRGPGGKYLKPNFARLLTPEGISDSSAFKKNFIGNADRSEVTLDVRSIDLKNTTYYYEKIGIEVTLVHDAQKGHVVFALVAKKSK